MSVYRIGNAAMMALLIVWSVSIAGTSDADEPDALPADCAGLLATSVGALFIVLILRSVSYAYESLGVSDHAAMWLLFASLLGSLFNIPIAELPPEQVMSNQVVDFFGMRYEVPVVSHWHALLSRSMSAAPSFRPRCRSIS